VLSGSQQSYIRCGKAGTISLSWFVEKIKSKQEDQQVSLGYKKVTRKLGLENGSTVSPVPFNPSPSWGYRYPFTRGALLIVVFIFVGDDDSDSNLVWVEGIFDDILVIGVWMVGMEWRYLLYRYLWSTIPEGGGGFTS
jgi:hypothetical protein